MRGNSAGMLYWSPGLMVVLSGAFLILLSSVSLAFLCLENSSFVMYICNDNTFIQLPTWLLSRAAAATFTRQDKTVNVANQAFMIGLAWFNFALLDTMYEATIVSLVEGLVGGFVAVQLSYSWALKSV